MANASQWLTVAEEALRAAVMLRRAEQRRSSCNRSYYSAHAAAHAVLRHFGQVYSNVRESRFNHRDLPIKLWGRLGTLSGGQMPLFKRKMYVDWLNACRTYRLRSDYSPATLVDSQASDEALHAARQLLELARRTMS